MKHTRRSLAIILCLVLLVGILPVAALAAGIPSSVLSAAKSVVRVEADYKNEYSLGSGFVISCTSTETLIATNNHVIEGSPNGIYIYSDGIDGVPAEIVFTTEDQDLCVLRLVGKYNLKPLAFGSAKQGDAIYTIGFPGAADYLTDEFSYKSSDATITDGIISAVRQTSMVANGPTVSLYQISAAINAGNSGGPLLNSKGQVIGINTLGIIDSEGIYAAVDVKELQSLLSSHGIQISSFNPLTVILPVAAVLVIAIVVFIILKKKKSSKAKGEEKAQTLKQYMDSLSAPLTVTQAVSLLMPVAVQLRQMHDNGQPHLQLSPGKISIRAGKARLLPPVSGESNMYSTGFTAPEIYKGKNNGNRTDIYSFCALLRYAVTDQVPANALERSESEYTGDSPAADDEEFNEIISCGMSVNSVDRFNSMQELILKLTPYNVQAELPSTSTTLTTPIKKEKPRKVKQPWTKKRKIRLGAFAIAALFVIVIGAYIGSYMIALDYADNGEFEKASDFLVIPVLTEIHDAPLNDYIAAGLLMDQEAFDESSQAFCDLNNYRKSIDFSNEAIYRKAEQELSIHSYKQAIADFKALAEVGYKDSQNRKTEAMVGQIYFNLDNDLSLNLMQPMLYDLKAAGYVDFETVKEECYSKYYKDAIDEYNSQNYYLAISLFKQLGTYSNSQQFYNLASLAYGYNNKDVIDDTIYESCLNNLTFENTKQVLVSYNSLALRFLKGTWKDKKGNYFTISGNDDNYTSSYSLPYTYVANGTFAIHNGIYTLSSGSYFSSDYKSVNEFKFIIMDRNTIEVYCYKDGNEYYMTRQ